MRAIDIPAERGVLGVVSDTHARDDLPGWLLDGLAEVDAILHAGDVLRPEVIEGLRELAPVYVVRGNNDASPWPEALSFGWAGWRIHLFHGHLGPGETARERSRRVAGADAVVYGHSHRAEVTRQGGVLYLNPGSPTRPRGGAPSAGHLVATEQGLEGSLWGPF